jgi:4-hydroxy-tetrahydrodipicolinate synthase
MPPASSAPFGRVLSAMVTPFDVDGGLDVDAAAAVAAHLADHGHDGLVISGTTGESPTTSVDENGRLLRAVIDAVGDRLNVVAGVGSNDTAHSVELARQAEKVGASGALLVTPYYSKPSQAGVLHHFQTVVGAAGLPVMLYDVPGRTGVQIAEDTYARAAEDDRVVAVKDAVGDLARGVRIMQRTGLSFYSGDDVLNLAWLVHGASGIVSVVAHAAGDQYAALVAAVGGGRLEEALAIYRQVLPAVEAIMTGPNYGAPMAKAALEMLGVTSNRVVRSPLLAADDEDCDRLRQGLAAAGLLDLSERGRPIARLGSDKSDGDGAR